MRRWERTWVGALGVVVFFATMGLVPDAWPFISWQMFSSPASETSSTFVVVSHGPDGEEVHRGVHLPGGFLTETYQDQFERSSLQERRSDCRRMLAGVADGPEQVRSVTLERWEWVLLERDGDRPAAYDREPLFTCGRDS